MSLPSKIRFVQKQTGICHQKSDLPKYIQVFACLKSDLPKYIYVFACLESDLPNSQLVFATKNLICPIPIGIWANWFIQFLKDIFSEIGYLTGFKNLLGMS